MSCEANNQSNVDPSLVEKIKRKQNDRQKSFSELRSRYPLNDKVKAIVDLSVHELLEKLKSPNRELTARQVLEAYIAKSLEVNDEFNCITEYIPQAFEWASSLDATKETLPLHGLPVAIKDDHNVALMDTTFGFAKNLYKPAKESAVLVQILMKLGAVPFCKTNIPQSIFSCGSSNPVFGTTLNARNKKLGPGGSSSGSGCIVAAGGAAFATGSDLGGSLRIPSLAQGLVTIRPTINRLSGKGVQQCLPNLVPLVGVPGFITKDVKLQALLFKLVTADGLQNQHDPLAMPIPWNEQLFSSEEKLRIGYFTSLSYFPSFDDVRNTVLDAKKAFESRGHTVVPFEMPDPVHMLTILCKLYFADNGEHLKQVFEGEPIPCCVAKLVESLRHRADISAETLSQRDKIFNIGPDKSSIDLLNILTERRAITLDILERMDKAGVDLILMPSYPFPAVKSHEMHDLHAIVHTCVWNLVDFPAGVVPFGVENGTGWDNYDDQGDPLLKAAKEAIRESKGMPITVQLIGRPFKEELVLKAQMELEQFKKGI